MRGRMMRLLVLPLSLGAALAASSNLHILRAQTRDAAGLLAPGDGIFGLPYGISGGAGFYPAYVNVADLNADSKLDLVVAGNWITPLGAAAPRVSVLLSNGDGTFTMPQALFGVGDAVQTAIADLNGDGKLDLAAPCQLEISGAGGVCMVFGNGNGTFGSQSGFAIGGYAEHLAIGDFDGDGVNDLATSNYSNNEVAVLFGKGNGTFDPPTTYPVGDFPRGIVAADFDEDGWPDLAVALRTDTEIALFFNNGDGTFQPHAALHPWIGRPNPLVAGDFNRDGHADLAVGGDSAQAVDVFLGLGDGSFQNFFGFRTSTYGSPVALTIGDFNSDGAPDLATAEYFMNSVALLLGAGNGRLAPRSNFQVGQSLYPVSVAAGDFNADGWEDLAVASEGSAQISIFLNQHPFPGVCNDADSDGFGVPGDPSCPGGAVVDCNDADSGIFPGAPEICDGIDNDCDLLDGFDDDLDGFRTCSGDCDDHQGNRHPGAREFCDGKDQDCDGSPDVPGENAKDIILSADGTSLSWTASTGYQVTYNLYRGNFGLGGSFYNQTCLLASLATPLGSDMQAPSVGRGFYYLASGRNSCGEGTLGPDWSGVSRPNTIPCP